MNSITERLTTLARERTDAYAPFSHQLMRSCVVLLCVVGVVARLSPLLDPDGRLFWQYMSEDGYLMQTVARNMAIGLGMSTAEGTIPTNGIQPLATFLFAALFWLVDGSREAGIALVTVFSTLVAAAAAYLQYRVGAKVLAEFRHGAALAAMAAALWLASPLVVGHSMNGLETGVYYLAILLTLDYYLAITAAGAALSMPGRLGFGLLLGIAFLARNDAVFFIGALLLAHLLAGGGAGGGLRHRLVDCLIAGFTSLLVASPWLANNYALFGTIMPISGIAESYRATLGQNLTLLPAHLFEATFLYAPIPGKLERLMPVALLACAAVTGVMAVFWWLVARSSLAARRFFIAGGLFAAGIVGYYGLFFGAPHFVSRYVSALSPFFWLFACASLFLVLHAVLRQLGTTLVPPLLLALACAFSVSDFMHGRSHMHRQVIEWVRENVGQSDWVGAVQTGTLGFFHDRTLNLDGKVNPHALRAKLEEGGDVRGYVLRSRINYIVDWVGITGWVESRTKPRYREDFAAAFVVAVKDPQRNLGVLKRVVPVAQE